MERLLEHEIFAAVLGDTVNPNHLNKISAPNGKGVGSYSDCDEYIISHADLYADSDLTKLFRITDYIKKIWEENGKNKKGKYVFLISIHLNAAGNGSWMSACGWTGWVATNAGQASRKLAQLLYCEAEKLGLKGNRSVPKEKYWSANFYILKNTKCPAVLTENMFQDNKDDVEFILSKDGIDKLTTVHVEGIRAFVDNL